MSKFESLSHSVYETRRVLRDRIGRMLRPPHEQVASESREAFDLTDVDMLQLLLRVQITHGDDVATVRDAYEKHRATHPVAPTFDALLDAGWFGVAWGRITAELRTRREMRKQSKPLHNALALVFDASRHGGTTFAFDDASSLPASAWPVATQLIDHPQDIHSLSAPSADWVAARLWEQRPTGDDETSLRWWADRWRLLGRPVGPPTRWWSKSDAYAWRRAAFNVLRSDPGLVDWEREKELVDAQCRVAWERAAPEYRIDWEHAHTPVMPSGLVERWGWLKRPHLESWGRAHELCGDTWILIAMLCEDICAIDGSLDSPSAPELLDLITTRPFLLELLATRVRQAPVLLADVLLHPRTSAWGCTLIANWDSHISGLWERSLQVAEATEARERAFADAIAIATLNLRSRKGPAGEMASLLVWLHDRFRADAYQRPEQRKITEHMLNFVQGELQSLSRQRLLELLEALSFRASEGLGTPRFTAALDVAALGTVADSLDADNAVAAYVTTLRSDAVPRSSIGLTPPQAAALVMAAKRSSKWDEFLSPIDMRLALVKARRAANEYMAKHEIARALRAHIRVLSRAIVAWEGTVPDEVVQALASAIRAGSSSHEEKGRVGAFSAQFETGFELTRVEPPPIADIADAYQRLPEASRVGLNEALLVIDEPLTLALFLQHAPNSLRAKLVGRIDALTPEDAAPMQSLSEVQGRIEALLNAGALEAASKYMGVERELETFGPVEGRAIARLRWELRLALAQNDFERIARAEPPDGLQPFEAASARDAIDFYQALAELKNPTGSASTAASLFAGLANRHPENSAYVVNRFAARLAMLLGRELFKKLEPADIPAAREAMREADRALQKALDPTNDGTGIHEANRALLLLAIGRNQEAYEALEHSSAAKGTDRAAAYSAVALSRLGRRDEANAVLAASEAAHPHSEALKAAREHLDLGIPGQFQLLHVSNDDPVPAIQSALYRLTQLPAGMQARVVSRETAEAFLTDEIRSAAAGVTSLAPHLREARLQEDDVTAILLRILEPRARLFGWSVPDQSLGGYSEKGNPGERDLVVKKDGYVITVIEAVVCNQNPLTETQRRNLASHLQKLVAYAQCRIFFHVVYSYVETPEDVITAMEAIAQTSVPEPFTHVRNDKLPLEDSRPIGFVATYTASGGREAKIVYLVMDMKQQSLRDAAALAGRTRGRAVARAEAEDTAET